MSGLALLKCANDQALNPALSRLAGAVQRSYRKAVLLGSWVLLGLVQGPNTRCTGDSFPVGAGLSWYMWDLEPCHIQRGAYQNHLALGMVK